jgi:hypothetical protein
MAFSLSLSLFFDVDRGDQGKLTSMGLDISLPRARDGESVCEALAERSNCKITPNKMK